MFSKLYLSFTCNLGIASGLYCIHNTELVNKRFSKNISNIYTFKNSFNFKKVYADEWVENWDSMGPSGKQETTYRTLIFIRHGEYSKESLGLNTLGKKQSLDAAKRLKQITECGCKIVRLHCSSSQRSIETMEIIKDHLKEDDLPEVEISDFAIEGPPCRNEPGTLKLGLREKRTLFNASCRIEASYREVFFRPKCDHNKETIEVFIGHANVQRYYITRSLQLPLEGWLRFQQKACTFTEFKISDTGVVTLVSSSETISKREKRCTRRKRSKKNG